ncbi:MAG TPA: hypothetical protein VFQ60_00410, partial [Patescibacteria group bacterium]|nr:hypothetical protein [Patescibacteria group bacterium]
MNERPKEHGNIEIYRERFLAQDKRLLEAAGILAARIKALPTDPKHPNWEPRALIVGGFVRDAILGLAPKDADIEVYGVSPDRLESILDQHFPHQVNKVGKAFGILKVNLGNGLDFDVSLPRRESKSGKGHTGFTTKSDPGMNIKEAARRRDFTMNALAADPLTGEIIDEFGGIQDLENGILRVTDAKRFQDDALRVYRGIQFCGRMNLTADPESKKLMQEMVKRGETDPKNELAIPVQTAKEICQLLNPDLPPRHIEKELEQLIEKEFSDLAAKHEISKDAFRKFIHDFDFPASPDQILKAVSQFEANPEEIISLTSRFVSNRDTRLIDVLSEQLDPRLSSERISEEIRKLLLKGKKPSVGFELMRELGMIDRHYPELRALVGTEQEPAWHKEGDVWNHTMRVIDSAAKLIRKTNFTLTEEEKLEVMIGALCHDLG